MATPTLLESLLRDQQDLTAVERFSQWHEDEATPAQEAYYRELIPLSLPGEREQYAFAVDLDACSGCKACVTACHSLNGLEEEEIWREVGLLTGGAPELPILQNITTACHHCVEPGCLLGCPVKAYDKDPVTGIVRHLDDQCMGCQYCILMCPYEVPKYSPAKGIVRKCDMCRQRLGVGEAPACVQSCPNQAIRIEIVSHAEVREAAQREQFLPDSPSPQITLPTTRFFSRKETLNGDLHTLVSGSRGLDEPGHAHAPLVVMLALSQLSVGLLLVERLLAVTNVALPELHLPHVGAMSASFLVLMLASIFSALGGGAAVLHLGRPMASIYAWLGLRTSWLSREIVAFGVYGGLIVGAAASVSPWRSWVPSLVAAILPWAAVMVGLMGLFCSAQLYAVTRRPYWDLRRSLAKFCLTMALLGLGGASLVTGMISSEGVSAEPITAMMLGVMVLAIAKLLVERELFWAARKEHSLGPRYLSRSVQLLQGPLITLAQVRILCGLVGGVALPLVVVLEGLRSVEVPPGAELPPLVLGISFVLLFAGELIERLLFFKAVIAPRMPGAPSHGHA